MNEVLSFMILFTEPICMVVAFLFFLFSAFVSEKKRKALSIGMHFFLGLMMIQAMVVLVMGLYYGGRA